MEYALVARWLVLYAALFALGLPVAARLFPRARGRGAGLAVPAAVVLLSVPAYWVGQVAWGPAALAAGVLSLFAGSALAALDLAALRAGRLRLDVDVDRSAATDAAVVFLLGFLFVVAIRAFDPAVHPGGGEKFLDFGLLKTLRRSPVLPPEDFWFANAPVKYYYGGHLTATLLSWLTGTPPRFAYNLALAGFYAALVTAAFELAAAIGADRGLPRRLAGVVAVFFVGLASNLVTAGRLALLALPDPLRQAAAAAVAARTDYTVERILAGADSFSYWNASRVIPGTINEFPLFAWLNGDLHAHMTGTPTLLLAAAVGYAYYRTPADERWRRRALVFAAIPVLASWQAIQNTWSFPSVLALGWLAATFAPADPWTLVPGTAAVRPRIRDLADRAVSSGDGPVSAATDELGRVLGASVVAAVAALVAVLFAAPFLFGAATGGGGRSVELLGPEMRSSLGALLLVHGAFAVGFCGYLLARLRVARPWYFLAGLLIAGYVGNAVGFAALAVSVPILVVAWVGLRLSRAVGYEAVLVVAGAGLVTLVELVYVNEQAGPGRMNTVFKTYAQVWVLWGTAMGVALPGLALERWGAGDAAAGGSTGDDAAGGVAEGGDVAGEVAEDGAAVGEVAEDGDVAGPTASGGSGAAAAIAGLPWRRVAAVVLAVALVASTSVYGVLAVGAHFERGPAGGPTLDATQFVETDHPEQAAAIDWIDGVEGRPTMLEAPGATLYPGGTDGRERAMYTWNANPASSLTGVPTVAGWRHEIGYRGREAYVDRVRDVDAMYAESASTRAALFRAYEVRYVWVGPNERARYGSVSFESAAIDVVHRSGDVTIYEVSLDELPSGSADAR
ncbi:hypothetical protein DVK02_03490 [Halobellus sp. Atlit-31R]|nr:hypothetical protein DVK02_03490 [Halobellus sp. Atlit-31R]